jgi:ATP-dependent exoDNAse (exonuclease V) beta subunit
LNTPAFSIYNASAGSGKTFALVKEYLKIILASPKQDAYKSILAITFTNKAVGEMKSRVVENLSQFANETPSEKSKDMLHIIAEELGMTPPEIQQKAKLILKHLIHNYASFSISTIDKFTSNVIRTFAHDLNLPTTFEISTETENLLQEAIDALLSQAGTDDVLTKLLVDFALEKTDDDKSWDVSRDIKEIGKLLSNENHRQEIEGFKEKSIAEFVSIKKVLVDKMTLCEQESLSLAKKAFQLINDNQLDEKSFSRGTVFKYFSKVSQGVLDYKMNVIPYFEEGGRYAKSVPQFQKDKVDEITPQLLTYYNQIIKKTKDHLLYAAFLKNLNPLSLLNKVSQELQKIQEEQNILSIAEFNSIIHEKIQNQPAPFIYERMGERYKYFFIDEFQDTSVMQWQNLIPLIDNAVSSEDLSGERGSIMIVGDPKQAIYRWRGGKAEQFIDLYHLENPFSNPEKERFPLTVNWRSYTEIINFNNLFFQFVSHYFENSDYKELYEKHSWQEKNSKEGGFVSLTFLPKSEKSEEESDDEVVTDSDKYLQATLETIHKVIQKGFSYKDIVVLTRKRDPGIQIAAYLTEHAIPIVSSETLMIANSKEVQAVIQFLYYLTNASNKDAKAKVLYYLGRYIQNTLPLFDFMDQGMKIENEDAFEEWLSKFDVYLSFQSIRRKSLYESVEIILKTILKPEKSDAYVQDFLDRVLEFEIRNQSGTADFLTFWETNSHRFSIPSPDGNNAVRLMTVHKSKGLEFPVVIFPFAEENYARSPKDKLWLAIDEESFGVPKALIDNTTTVEEFGEEASSLYFQKKQEELLDNVNILYVALTRAEEQLYVISKMNLSKEGEPAKSNMSSFFIAYLQHKNLFDSNKFVYEFGNDDRVSSPKSIENPLKKIPLLHEVFDFNAIKIAHRESLMWGTKQQHAIEFGTVIHEILSHIKSTDDLDIAIEKSIEDGIINYNQRTIVKETLQRIVTHEELLVFYDQNNKTLNEQTIIQKNGPLLKPDRVVILPDNHAGLIDYKTGLPQQSHIKQIETYSSALEEMGYIVSKKALVYIGEKLEIVHL